MLSAASATTPAPVANPINFRRLIGERANRSRALAASAATHTPAYREPMAAAYEPKCSRSAAVPAAVAWASPPTPLLAPRSAGKIPALRLEAERRLQLHPAIDCVAGRERSALQRVRNTKQPRSQHSIGIGHVHIIEDVAHTQAKGEVVAPVGVRRHHHRPAPAIQRPAVPMTAIASPRAALATFGFASQPNRLAQAEVQHKMPG